MTKPRREPVRGTSEEGHRMQMPPGRPGEAREDAAAASGGTPGRDAPAREGPEGPLPEPPARSDGAKAGVRTETTRE